MSAELSHASQYGCRNQALDRAVSVRRGERAVQRPVHQSRSRNGFRSISLKSWVAPSAHRRPGITRTCARSCATRMPRRRHLRRKRPWEPRRQNSSEGRDAPPRASVRIVILDGYVSTLDSIVQAGARRACRPVPCSMCWAKALSALSLDADLATSQLLENPGIGPLPERRLHAGRCRRRRSSAGVMTVETPVIETPVSHLWRSGGLRPSTYARSWCDARRPGASAIGGRAS